MRAPFVILAVLCAAVLFTGLARTGFLDAREARDAEVGRELAAARELLTPLFGAEPLFEKPVVAYAPDAVIRVLARRPEFASRLFRAIVAVLLIVVTGSVAALYFGPRSGWCATGVLVTSFALPHAARVDGTQLLATLFAWLGCAGLADALFVAHGGRAMRLVLAYAALGFALITGGLLPAVWPLGAVALYLALARRQALWRRLQPLAGLAIMAGIAAPWYGAMIERYGREFLVHAPFFPYAIEPRGPVFAGPVVLLSFLVIGLFPWSTLLPGAILHAATWWRHGSPAPALERAQESREENAAHFFIACLVASLAPVLFYPTPPLTAVLPAAPAVALLCSRLLSHAYEDDERVAAPIGRAVAMLALVGSTTSVLLVMAANALRDAAPELRLLAAVLFVTSWVPLLTNLARRRRLAAMLIALPVAVCAPIVNLRLLPGIESYLSTRLVARAMARTAPPLAPLLLVEPAPATLRLYGEYNLVVVPPTAAAFAAGRSTDGHSYLAFRPGRERDVARAAAMPLEILMRTPSLVLARE